MRKIKGTIAIDFDGTIVEHAYPHIGKLKKDARRVINRLYQDWRIIIWTCRNNPRLGNIEAKLAAVRKFLDEARILYDEIDTGKQGKVIADWYIDDRGIAFRDNWAEIGTQLEHN